MSNLSDFIGGGGSGSLVLGYVETADGSFTQVATGAGVAYVDYASEPVQFSTDGSTEGGLVDESGYVPYTSGLWVKNDAPYRYAIALSEAS